jgi:AraC family transcriptional regulator
MHTTFGDILGERLHAEHHPALLARALPQGEVSVVEVRSEQPTFELTDPLPRRDIDYRPGVGIEDPVFKHLALSVMPAFAHPERASRLFVDHVTLTVAVHISTTYGLAKPRHPVARGGLSSWQKRRALELIDAHLDGALGIIELARSCRLSSSHFAHAFKQSTGLTPHRWLTCRRIEKAKGLLRDATWPLVHVAAECGFANQSHFTRVFTSVVGTPPGDWRRRNGPLAES